MNEAVHWVAAIFANSAYIQFILTDVRVGKDVHVLMACGLGGTSLINAMVDAANVTGLSTRAANSARSFVEARRLAAARASATGSIAGGGTGADGGGGRPGRWSGGGLRRREQGKGGDDRDGHVRPRYGGNGQHRGEGGGERFRIPRDHGGDDQYRAEVED